MKKSTRRKKRRGRLTQIEIPHAAELDVALKLGPAEDLAADGVLAGVVLVDGDGLCARVDADDAGGEALLELVREVGRDGLFDDDVREEAVGRGGCARRQFQLLFVK
jgi:hypothetical protein